MKNKTNIIYLRVDKRNPASVVGHERVIGKIKGVFNLHDKIIYKIPYFSPLDDAVVKQVVMLNVDVVRKDAKGRVILLCSAVVGE